MNEQITPPATHLSPPWYTLQKKVNAVLASPHVAVGQLDTTRIPYIVPIKVDDRNIAIAIASILPSPWTLGNILVAPAVTFEGKPVTPVVPTSTDELTNLVKTAFKDNPLMQEVIVHPLTPVGGPGIVFPIFAAAVAQFWNDDLSDCFGNFNEVLSTCARSVLAPAPGGFALAPSTTKIAVGKTEETRQMATAKV